MSYEYVHVDPLQYSSVVLNRFHPGVLLNTRGEKFNSMVIGWGQIGLLWGNPVFTVYIRSNRYSKAVIDETGEFTVCVPMERLPRELMMVCGRQSGRDINKADYLTVADPQTTSTPGVLECPITFECKVIYKQDQIPEMIPREAIGKYYNKGEDADHFHTMYIGRIVDCYIIKSQQ